MYVPILHRILWLEWNLLSLSIVLSVISFVFGILDSVSYKLKLTLGERLFSILYRFVFVTLVVVMRLGLISFHKFDFGLDSQEKHR